MCPSQGHCPKTLGPQAAKRGLNFETFVNFGLRLLIRLLNVNSHRCNTPQKKLNSFVHYSHNGRVDEEAAAL